jgi:4-hydroxy-tetrahydrodipicolinate synthase
MTVYPGSELPLTDALELGAAGCITATANINASDIAKVVDLYDQGDVTAARELHETVKRFRLILQKSAPIPAQKRLLALATGDPRWANVRPPLTPMAEETGRRLAAILKREFNWVNGDILNLTY